MRHRAATEKLYHVYSRSSPTGCKVLRNVTREQGEAEVAAGRLHRKYDDYSGELIGYQAGLSRADERGEYDLRMPMSFGSISSRDAQVNAGCMGESRTSGMGEDQRLAMAVPEDHVERVRAKVRVYVHVTAVVGDILRVWPR